MAHRAKRTQMWLPVVSDSSTLQENPYSHFMGKDLEDLDLSPGIRSKARKPGVLFEF